LISYLRNVAVYDAILFRNAALRFDPDVFCRYQNIEHKQKHFKPDDSTIKHLKNSKKAIETVFDS
jgi:hypothetical protein